MCFLLKLVRGGSSKRFYHTVQYQSLLYILRVWEKMYSVDSCKVNRATGAVPTRLFTPPHTPRPLFTAIFFAKMHAIRAAPCVAPSAGLQGHWSGADAAARTPAAAPTPAAAALAVAAATDAQGRRRALRELEAAVVATRRRHHLGTPPCAALCGPTRFDLGST